MAASLFSCKKSDGLDHEHRRRVEELQNQKSNLLNEIYRLENGMEAEIGINSYMSFIFLGCDAAIYDEILPIFETEEVKLTGVICIYENELPGTEGNISVEEYFDLLSRGWETALYWKGIPEESEADGKEILRDFISVMNAEFSEFMLNTSEYCVMLEETYGAEISFPESIVFADGCYSAEYDAVIESFGIRNVIHDGSSELGLFAQDKPEGIWKSAAIGWRNLSYSIRLKRHIESKGGYASFKIGFDNSEDDYETSFHPIEGESLTNGVRLEVFKRMIDNFTASIQSGDIHVKGISGAREGIEKYYADKAVYLDYSSKRIAEIRAMISEIEYQIIKIYEEYSD